MPEKMLTLSATYIDAGKIRLASGKILAWEDLGAPLTPPELPYGTNMKVTIVLEAPDYLHGSEGAVWATYDREQAEIVLSALQAQRIAGELKEILLQDHELYVLHVHDPAQAEAAMNFIWRDSSGLRLQPDWRYPPGAVNESFLRWLEG